MKENQTLNNKRLMQAVVTLKDALQEQAALIQDIRYAQIYEKGRLTTLIKNISESQAKVDADLTAIKTKLGI